MIETLKKYMRAYKNWPQVLLYLFRRRFSKIDGCGETDLIPIVTRDDEKCTKVGLPLLRGYAFAKQIKNSRISDLHIVNNLLCFNDKSISLKLDVGCGADPYAVFFFEEYSFLIDTNETNKVHSLKEKVVVDIGGNIGDSGIYFAINGAKKVISLEPYPYLFDIATKNIIKNDLVHQVELVNAGYGRDDTIGIDVSFVPDNSSSLKINPNGPKINTVSLKTLVKRYHLEDALLKMDCEGCEYNIVNESIDILRKFNKMIIEYH